MSMLSSTLSCPVCKERREGFIDIDITEGELICSTCGNRWSLESEIEFVVIEGFHMDDVREKMYEVGLFDNPKLIY